jgi:hypothetical protein
MAATQIVDPARDQDPTLNDMLSDPIVEAMMQADRVDRRALQALLREVAQTRRVAAVVS